MRVALKVDGSVVTWNGGGGAPGFGPAGLESGVTDIAASSHHVLATKNGGVVIWGGDSGYGETTVPGYASSGATAIAAGSYFSGAIINGEVKVWGSPYSGYTTVPVAAQSGALALAAGRDHLLAITSTGGVVAWGINYNGTTNVPTGALSDVVAIAVGNWHNLALKSDGTVVAWGSNYAGETDVPVGLTDVQAISAGYDFSMALKTDGTVVCWGSNNGTRTFPPTLHDVSGITAGTFGAYAIRAPFAAETIVSPNSIVSGSAGTGTVTLTDPAPAGGATVTLSSNDGLVHVPASATILEGETTATFPVTTEIVFGGGRGPTISTTYAGETHKTSFLVSAHSANLALSRSSVIAGSDQAIIGTLTLSSTFPVPLTFTLSASAGVDLPVSVKVPAGKSVVTFKALTTKDIATGSYWDEWDEVWYPYINSIGADYQGAGYGASFVAVPLTASLSLANSGYAGQYVSGLVTLNARPRFTTPVAISTDDVAMPGFSVDVMPGTSASGFNLYLPIDSASHKVIVTAGLNGTNRSRTISILANDLASLTLSSSSVTGGTSVTGTVSVRYPVGVNTTVAIASNKIFAGVPATVTILAGSKSATFTATTTHVNYEKLVKLTATRNGKTLTANLTITP